MIVVLLTRSKVENECSKERSSLKKRTKLKERRSKTGNIELLLFVDFGIVRTRSSEVGRLWYVNSSLCVQLSSLGGDVVKGD